MESTENQETSSSVQEGVMTVNTFTSERRNEAVLLQQGENGGCSCGGNAVAVAPPTYIYAIGRIEPRFRSLSLEKEFTQANTRTETTGLTEQEVKHKTLSMPENRYLVRQLCWVLKIAEIETYLLQPRCAADYELLVESLRPRPSRLDLDVVIGIKGSIAPPEYCNGLMVPFLAFDQIYSFDSPTLINAIPTPEKMSAKEFASTAEGLLERIMQMADNAGATDEHRALNYLAMRYPKIYTQAFEYHNHDCSLSGIEVRPSRLSGTRNIVSVIFSFTHRKTDVIEKYFVRVDVTEQFPFLVTKMAPFFDR